MSLHVVYVVTGSKKEWINSRVAELVTIGNSHRRMILVCPGDRSSANAHLSIKPFPNLTAALSLLGFVKLKKRLDKLLYFPSDRMRYSIMVQRQLAKRIKVDQKNGWKVCVITCVPPHDLCLAGLYLKRKFPSIKWIIDWQDLWSYDENYFERIPKIYRKRALRLEKNALDECDLNVTTNFYAKNVLESDYGIDSSRIHEIHHHFSQSDYSSSFRTASKIINDRNNGVIRLGFLGILFKPPRVPGQRLLDALEDAQKAGINVELHIFGNVSEDAKKLLANRKGLVLHGKASHKESLEGVANCDFLLLILADLANSRAVMSIKLPHYLLLDRPIIAFTPDPSAVADIVRQTGSGYVIPASHDWAEGLIRVIRSWQEGKNEPKRNEDEIKKYDWNNISKEWEYAISRPFLETDKEG